MADVPILRPEQRWECPSCDFTDVTHIAGYVSHLHPCRGQLLLMVPMVPAGTERRAAHSVHRPEDYIGGTLIRRDAEGLPVTHVTTERDDGEDATVYPATATIEAEALRIVGFNTSHGARQDATVNVGAASVSAERE